MRSDDMIDTYGAGRYLLRWQLVDGQPRCLDDAFPVASTPAAMLDQQRDRNAHLRARLAAVEAFEASTALLARTGNADDFDPEREAAIVTVRDASDLTRAYALVRLGCPQEPTLGDEPSAEWLAYQQAVGIITEEG
ncbi:hypothetical protein [Azospirillum argentinense]|uniref:Uncharacterized protein n=1 Tax=Azospirillum argentinense TaxID=2970906 RepID=A0ABW8VH26_9PROT